MREGPEADASASGPRVHRPGMEASAGGHHKRVMRFELTTFTLATTPKPLENKGKAA